MILLLRMECSVGGEGEREGGHMVYNSGWVFIIYECHTHLVKKRKIYISSWCCVNIELCKHREMALPGR
jgi:hypothetical protein